MAETRVAGLRRSEMLEILRSQSAYVEHTLRRMEAKGQTWEPEEPPKSPAFPERIFFEGGVFSIGASPRSHAALLVSTECGLDTQEVFRLVAEAARRYNLLPKVRAQVVRIRDLAMAPDEDFATVAADIVALIDGEEPSEAGCGGGDR